MSIFARMRYLISVDGFLRFGTYYLTDVSAVVETLRLAGHHVCVRHAETGREWVNMPVDEIIQDVVTAQELSEKAIKDAG